MLKGLASLCIAVTLLITQSFGVAAHCISAGPDDGARQHHAASSHDHSDHLTTHQAAAGLDHHAAHHTHAGSDDASSDNELNMTFGDCITGFVGLEPNDDGSLCGLDLKPSFARVQADMLAPALLLQPTPPPNVIL